jgi:hypothetical protein
VNVRKDYINWSGKPTGLAKIDFSGGREAVLDVFSNLVISYISDGRRMPVELHP